VHVFDKKTRQAVTDATVTMSFASLDRKGSPTGGAIAVPVVVMQAIGKGPASTHYGNNVTMPAGRYKVTVSVNGPDSSVRRHGVRCAIDRDGAHENVVTRKWLKIEDSRI